MEGLADLINAETRAQQRQALQHTGGHATAMYERWRSQLVDAWAHVEALINFGEDENIDEVKKEEKKKGGRRTY